VGIAALQARLLHVCDFDDGDRSHINERDKD
jgi:hypothetical protein